MNRMILCQNNYPLQVLPSDWTETQANELTGRLNRGEDVRLHDLQGVQGMRRYYHYQIVPETGEFQV